MTDDIEPYEAGYMKPPEEHRFKAGRSGNPKGRPKRIDDPFTALQKVLARQITVGDSKKIAIQEALIRRCANGRSVATSVRLPCSRRS